MIKSVEEIEKIYKDIIKSDKYMLMELDDCKMLIRTPNEYDFKLTLFHGTSIYMLNKFLKNGIIEFSEESKMNYNYALKVIYNLNHILDEHNLPTEKQLLVDNILSPDRIDYTYKYMCLTTNIYVAKSYATEFKQVGELNYTILEIYNHIKKSGKSELLSKIPTEYINYIHQLEEAKDSKGVILFVKNLDYKYICMNEKEEKIPFKEILKSAITGKRYNIHYHGKNTLDIEIVPYDQVEEKYAEYLNNLKKQLEKYKVSPFKNLEFETEKLKTKAILMGYKFLMN